MKIIGQDFKSYAFKNNDSKNSLNALQKYFIKTLHKNERFSL